MICRKCNRSIPDNANKCPYCRTRTLAGWKNEGNKLIAPVKKVFTNPFKKKY